MLTVHFELNRGVHVVTNTLLFFSAIITLSSAIFLKPQNHEKRYVKDPALEWFSWNSAAPALDDRSRATYNIGDKDEEDKKEERAAVGLVNRNCYSVSHVDNPQ